METSARRMLHASLQPFLRMTNCDNVYIRQTMAFCQCACIGVTSIVKFLCICIRNESLSDITRRAAQCSEKSRGRMGLAALLSHNSEDRDFRADLNMAWIDL